jgi:hypothetical protein
MNRSKLFIIVFTLMAVSFLVGRDFGNEQYKKLVIDYKQLEAKYDALMFETQNWRQLSPEQKLELNKGNVQLGPGTYVVGEYPDLVEGTFKIYVAGNEPGTITINDTTYNLCPDPTAVEEKCTTYVESIVLQNGDKIIVDGVTVRTTFSKE